jgi:predicted Zn-dependent peptidase
MQLSQAKLVIGLRTTVLSGSDDVSAMRLCNALLGGTPHSLLFRNVREKLQLCYYCASSYDRLKGILLIDSGLEESSATKAVEEILRQIDAICRGTFTEEDLESARLSVVNQYQTLGDLQSTLTSWYLGQSLDDVLTMPEQAADGVKAVTRDQVIAAAHTIRPELVYLLAGEEDT